MDLTRRLTTAKLRVRSIWRRGEVERELDDELSYHLERLTARLEAEGLSPAAARAAAIKTLGGVAHAKDECRDTRRLGLLEDFVQDLRVAVRSMRRRAGATVIALLTLALGIGSTTAVVSVVNGLWLKAPYPDADRIVWIFEMSPKGGMAGVSALNYLDWRNQARAFEAMGCWSFATATLDEGEVPLPLRTAFVSASYFDVFGLKAARGRVFTAADERAGQEHVVVLSHELWQNQLAGDPSIVGRAIRVRGDLYTVVGVLPPNATAGEWSWTQIWLPRTFEASALTRDFRNMNVFGKLRPGVPFEEARREMRTIASRLSAEYPDSNRGWDASLSKYIDQLVDSQLRNSLIVLLVAVGAVLLIACVNLASVRLVSALAQERETAIRAALGGGRLRLVRQYATESLLLAVCGAALGVVLAQGMLAAIRSTLPAFSSAGSSVPPSGALAMDGRMLAFAIALAVGTSLLCGLVPALVALRVNLADSAKDRRIGHATKGTRARLRRAFVVVEVALAFVLLVSAVELLTSVRRLQQSPLGFQPAGVLTALTPLSAALANGDAATRTQYLERVLVSIQRLPGVASAALTSVLPLQGWGSELPFQRRDGPPVPEAERPVAFFKMISADYFSTLGIEQRRGRAFAHTDSASAPRVAVINETMARLYFADTDPVGRIVLVPQLVPSGSGRYGPDVPWEIVGVVADERVTRLKEARVSPGLYVPFAQSPMRRPSLVARLPQTPGAEVALRRAAAAASRDQALADVKWLDVMRDESLGADRQRSIVIAAFAICAVLLAAIGIYGVLSQMVAHRTHELGVRAAIGAEAGALARLVVEDGLMLSGIGVGLGWLAWLVTSRVLGSVLQDFERADARTLVAAAVAMTAIAAAACYTPARRATSADPLLSLRPE